MTISRGLAALIACTAVVFVAPLSALTASAYSTGGVSAGPLHWDPANPATRAYYIPTILPGGTFHDSMRVQNPNRDSVDLLISAVDGVTATPSGAVYANRTDPVRKAGAWLTPDRTQLTLAPGQLALVGFTVRAPASAVPGDHLAGMAFENAHPIAGSGSVNISSTVRTVVGVLIKVPGAGAFNLVIGPATIQPLAVQGLASLVIPLTDTGRLLGRPLLTVTVSEADGHRRTVSRQLDSLLPGDTIQYPFPWPDSLGPGDYTIQVSGLGSGMAAPATSTSAATLHSPLRGVGMPRPPRAAGPVIAAAPSWLIPLAAGGAALLITLLGATGFLMVVVRRQRREAAARAAPGARPAEAAP